MCPANNMFELKWLIMLPQLSHKALLHTQQVPHQERTLAVVLLVVRMLLFLMIQGWLGILGGCLPRQAHVLVLQLLISIRIVIVLFIHLSPVVEEGSRDVAFLLK